MTRYFTIEEVNRHCTLNDCWLAINGDVYSIPLSWFKAHPGGELPILNLAGKDCTDAFLVFHPNWVLQKFLKRYRIGKLQKWELTPLQQDFHNVRKQIEDDGLYETSYFYYFQKLLIQFLLLFLAVSLLVIPSSKIYLFSFPSLLSPSSGASISESTATTSTRWLSFVSSGWFVQLSRILSAIFLACFWQQMAFLGHDFGHHSVSRSQFWDTFGGWITTSVLGISGHWWQRNHNVHHIHTNSLQYDPDIQYLPIFAISNKMFQGFFSYYYERWFKFDRLAQIIVSYQHLLYYPILSVARFNLYIQSIKMIFDSRNFLPIASRITEFFAMLTYFSLYALLMGYISSWMDIIIYTIICHAFAGLLHLQITLSHFFLDVTDGNGYDKRMNDPHYFILSQLDRSMDIEALPGFDWFHGGLNFQVEHHLFPRVPRHNLRCLKEKYVLPFVERNKLPYHAASFYQANIMVLNQLKTVALEARQVKPK